MAHSIAGVCDPGRPRRGRVQRPATRLVEELPSSVNLFGFTRTATSTLPVIAAAFTRRGFALSDAQAVLGESWWAEKRAQVRWAEFREASPGLEIPAELAEVVAEVDRRLPKM